MRPTIVTGFIPLPGHPKSDRYLELGQRLLNLGLPIDAYLDSTVVNKLTITSTTNVSITSQQSCWAHSLIELHKPQLPPTDNPNKDTMAFHTIQLQKSRWLSMSACGPSSVYIWIDFGILHIPGLTENHILEFYERVCNFDHTHIGMPIIWPITSESIIPYDRPNWFCAGGLLIMPDCFAGWFDAMVTTRTEKYIMDAHMLTWEINIWASILREHSNLFYTWKCDHNETMFTGFGRK